jgi:hypothetical protein
MLRNVSSCPPSGLLRTNNNNNNNNNEHKTQKSDASR